MNIMGIKTKNAQSIFRKKSIYVTYPAHYEWQNTLKIHWYSTGPTIYNWNTMFQYWDTTGLGSGSYVANVRKDKLQQSSLAF